MAGEIRALERGEAFDPAWVQAKLDGLMETLALILDQSADEGLPTFELSANLARARIAESRG